MSETKFTDDDLKRLKEEMHKDFTGWWPHNVRTVEALLARLEAAEAIIPHAKALSDRCKQEQTFVFAEVDDIDDLEFAWRKAARK